MVNGTPWSGREGKALGVIGPPDTYDNPRLSPDGKRLAVSLADSFGNRNLWQVEFATGQLKRFTFDTGVPNRPVWSPDGRQIVFSSMRSRHFNLYRKDASGAGQEEQLTQSDLPHNPTGLVMGGSLCIRKSPRGREPISGCCR